MPSRNISLSEVLSVIRVRTILVERAREGGGPVSRISKCPRRVTSGRPRSTLSELLGGEGGEGEGSMSILELTQTKRKIPIFQIRFFVQKYFTPLPLLYTELVKELKQKQRARPFSAARTLFVQGNSRLWNMRV